MVEKHFVDFVTFGDGSFDQLLNVEIAAGCWFIDIKQWDDLLVCLFTLDVYLLDHVQISAEFLTQTAHFLRQIIHFIVFLRSYLNSIASQIGDGLIKSVKNYEIKQLYLVHVVQWLQINLLNSRHVDF